MERPKLYYNNVLRDAQEGDDGTAYATITETSQLSTDPNELFGEVSLITDLSTLATHSGASVEFSTTGNEYHISDIDTLPARNLNIVFIPGRIGAGGDGRFVVVGNSTNCDISDDGVNWTPATINPSGGIWMDVAWDGNRYVAVSQDITDNTSTSEDAGTWTVSSLPGGLQYSCVAAGGTCFCALQMSGSQAAISTTGTSWTGATISTSGNWYDIQWNGNLFCAIGGSTNRCATSTNGYSWTNATMSATLDWRALAWNGTLFCAVAQGSSTCACSTNGSSWTSYTMPTSMTWNDIAWNGSIFCAVAAQSTSAAAISTNGSSWTAITLPTQTSWYSIASNGSVFCAIGHGTASAVSADGLTWYDQNDAYLTVFERLQDQDIGDTCYLRHSLSCNTEADANPAFHGADNHKAPLFLGTENTQVKIRAHLPNAIKDGGFESGALPPNWSGGTGWAIESSTELEGQYSVSWDLAASNHLSQTVTDFKLEKDRTYRLVCKMKSVTANPTAGVLTVQLKQTGTDTSLDSDASGTTPSITTTAAWLAIDFTPEFTSDNWYLRFYADHTKANGATEITLDEVYLYRKRTVNTLIVDGHNWEGKSVTVNAWKCSPLRSTASIGAGDGTEIGALTIDTSDTAKETLTEAYDPVYEIILPASAGWTAEAGEIYLGDYWQVPRYAQPLDPWEENEEGLHHLSLSFRNIPAAYRTTNIRDLFERLRDGDAIYAQWDTELPVLMEPRDRARKAPYNPHRIDLDLDLIERL